MILLRQESMYFHTGTPTMEKEVAVVQSLMWYPIKSAGVIELQEARVTELGLQDVQSGVIDRL